MKYALFQFKTALDNFRRNKTRMVLASLGIMIGVLSVVMLIALGLGLKNYIQGQFEDLGANLVIVLPGSGFSQGTAGFTGLAGGISFDEKDVVELSKISEFDYVAPVFMKTASVEARGEEELGYIIGSNEDYFELSNLKPLVGENLTASDIERKSKHVVLGYLLSEKLFGAAENGLGQTVKVSNQRYKVVGVTEKKGDNEVDNSVVMSYKTTYGSLNPDKKFFTIYMGVTDDQLVETAKEKAKAALLDRYDEDDFSISEQSEILSIINNIFGIINGFLIAIGSISLFVGGIGIMNIMYANVTERTKEIGIRRAIGATRRDIMYQFLAESVLLSGTGGVVGLVLSALIVVLVRPFFPVALNGLAVAVAIGISTAIGVFFGVFPARRAAKLTPIEAIRYE